MPGSGNTWVRHLLEEVTGIYTGSVYADFLMKDVFKGAKRKDGVSVIKTHKTISNSFGFFNRTVLIIRDPFETLLSEFNRKHMKSKTMILPRLNFSEERFTESLYRAVPKWKSFYEDWMTLFPWPLFVLFYDALMSDLKNSVAKLCLFLDIPVTIRDLLCMESRREGLYHRPSKPEYMSRSNLVPADLEKQIRTVKSNIVKICLRLVNRTSQRIKSNL